MAKLNLTKSYVINKALIPLIIGLLVVGALIVLPLLFSGSNNPGNDLDTGKGQDEELAAEKPVKLEIAGVIRTLEVLRAAGLTTSGSRIEPSEPRYSINKVNGVNVGVVSYTYESAGSGADVAINGDYVSDETAQLINSFSYDTLDVDLEKIKTVIDEAKKEGADIIVLYLHWGEEYQQVPNKWQEQIVKSAVEEMNVDLIFASHTHVIQKMEMVRSEKTGKKVPVFYSMGNFISNQREETVQNRYTEQGMIARVELEYMAGTGDMLSVKMSYTPTWVDKYKRAGKTVYEVIPLDEEMETNPALIESGHLSKAIQALEDINGILKIN